MEKYQRYKHLLEYFTTHLEYIQKDSTDLPGYDKYLAPIKNNFSKSGTGYAGAAIQNQIADWSQYGDYEVCINISCSFGSFMTAQCYLNWNGTWFNTRPQWNKQDQKIIGFYLSKQEKAAAKAELSFSLDELGLFDNKEPNVNLKNLFDAFEQMILNEERELIMQTYIKLLKANRNLILTGAPGTGKTYLAQQIAKSLGATMANGQCRMVQFHPSYDYTDFVEGLRPIKGDSDTNIGFKRIDGSFKDFCKKAIKNSRNNGVDNFDEAWNHLIERIEENGFVEMPLLSGSRKLHIELNEYGTGLTERTYDETGENKIKGASKFFTKEQLKNIYEGRKGVESGGHDTYRKAIIIEMKKNFGLKDYVKATDYDNNEKTTKYVFIIDEINRGEISKIFGELFFSVDPSYRGKSGLVDTQYQNLIDPSDVFAEGFYIPENIYIIGTMNDIDRSVESMDFAMRRRFAWKEIKASDRVEMLGDKDNGIPDIKDEAIERMERLNKAIESIEGLSSAYHIGPAYFLKMKLYDYKNNLVQAWQSLWDNHLKGLLYEYLRGYETEEIDKYLSKLENAYNLVPDTETQN